jgi:cation diffusion facilitator family transporter
MAGQDHGSVRAILYALGANFGIAVAKGGAAFWTGSGAMLAETIHSLADCANQVLLLIGVKRAGSPPTPEHPLGYGRVMYFWSLIVALLLFSVGGLFSVYEGYQRFHHAEGLRDPWIAIGILVFSIVLEAISLAGALKVIRQRQGNRTLWQWFRTTRQSELMVVAGEDIAALGGLVFALIALLLAIATGNVVFDAIGSIAIGVLLIVIAMAITLEVKSLIIGESADPVTHEDIKRFIGERPEVESVLNFITLQWGDHIVVAAKVHMKESRDASRMIEQINACEAALKRQFPEVKWIFFEPDTAD